MKKLILKSFFTAGLILCAVSCRYDFSLFPRDASVEKRSPSFSELTDGTNGISETKPGIPANGKFSIILIGDTHFGRDGWFKPHRNEDPFYVKLASVAETYNTKGFPICFGINVGDNSDSGKQSEFDDNKFCETKISEILKDKYNSADGRTYSVVGNHDLYNDGWSNWKKNTYPHTSTYYFTLNGIGCNLSFYFLDSGSGLLGEKQLSQFDSISGHDPNKKVIISHYPVYAKNVTYYSLSNPLEIAKLLKIYGNNNITYGLEGHFHPGGDNTVYSENGNYLFHEEVLSGFVDRKAFYILEVDLSGTEPKLSIEKFNF